VHRGRKGLAELAGVLGLLGLLACWLGLLAAVAGLAGCGPAALLFLSLIFCFSLFLSSWSTATLYLYFSLLFHGKLLGALCPLYSRLACELIKALLEPQFV
jgi:hypothetical protein